MPEDGQDHSKSQSKSSTNKIILVGALLLIAETVWLAKAVLFTSTHTSAPQKVEVEARSSTAALRANPRQFRFDELVAANASAETGEGPVTRADQRAEGSLATEEVEELFPQAQAYNARQSEDASPLSPPELFKMAAPGVATLIVKDEDEKEIGQGSAFVVKVKQRIRSTNPAFQFHETLLVTNFHVIRGAVSAEVTFSEETGWLSNDEAARLEFEEDPRFQEKRATEADGGAQFKAGLRMIHSTSVFEVVGEDENADIAILRVQSTHRPPRAPRALPLQSPTLPEIGTRVYALGSPIGLSNTFSEGIISGVRETGEHDRWIQITTPIGPGSSGGPVLTAQGTVLGVATSSIVAGQNLNFAVPSSEVAKLLNSPGKPRKLWMGTSIREERADAFSTLYHEMGRVVNEGGNPSDGVSLLIGGHELSKSGDHVAAVEKLRQALRAGTGNYGHLAHYALAEALFDAAMIRKDHIDAAIRKDHIQPADLKAAVASLRKAKELNADFAPPVERIAWIYLVFSEQYPEALLEADALVKMRPHCSEAYSLRGQIWAKLGRVEAFENDLATAMELRPNCAKLHTVKGCGYMGLRDWEKAASALIAATALYPEDWYSHRELGVVYQNAGEYVEAVKHYETFLQLFKEHELSSPSMDEDVNRSIAECRRRMQSP